MGAKKLSWKPTAEEPHPDWRTRTELLTVFNIMFITKYSYGTILEMVKNRALKPVKDVPPYRFTPAEVVRVFFREESIQDNKPTQVEKTKTEVKRRITKRAKGDLWRD